MANYLLLFLLILMIVAAPAISIIGLCLRSKPIGVKLYTYSSIFSCIEIAGLMSSPVSSLLYSVLGEFVALVLTIALFFLSYKLCQNLWPAVFPSKQRSKQADAVRSCILSALDTLNVSTDFFPYYGVKSYMLSCLDEYGGKYSGTMQHEYECADGRIYRSSPTSPVLFLFVCIGRYAVDCSNDKLRSYCDKHIEEARRAEFHSHW